MIESSGTSLLYDSLRTCEIRTMTWFFQETLQVFAQIPRNEDKFFYHINVIIRNYVAWETWSKLRPWLNEFKWYIDVGFSGLTNSSMYCFTNICRAFLAQSRAKVKTVSEETQISFDHWKPEGSDHCYKGNGPKQKNIHKQKSKRSCIQLFCFVFQVILKYHWIGLEKAVSVKKQHIS